MGSEQQNLIQSAPYAEANLLRQGNKMLLSHGISTPQLMVSPTRQALVALRDPLNTGRADKAVQSLMDAAKGQSKFACFYKCTARTALQARQNGFFVLPIAREAWLDPRSFTTETSNHRQLRRKLRKAEKAGVTTVQFDAQASTQASTLPLQDMARVSADWVARSGGERGFSMGLFTPELLQSQRCYLAMQDGQLRGFITLNTCDAEWSLDLMRQTAAAPDGTMHALLAHALKDASDRVLPRLSLASVPFEHRHKALNKWVEAASGSAGLKQFKSAFAPNWQTLYMATPNRLQFVIAAVDIAREITGKVSPK